MHLQSAQSISDSSCPIKRALGSLSAAAAAGSLAGRPGHRGSVSPSIATARQRKSLGVRALDLPQQRHCVVCLFARAPP